MARLKQNRLYRLLSILYGGLMECRNFLFDKKIRSSHTFPIPIICIGNLAVGGTGKTPHTEFILRNLKKNYNLSVLSRGYKRKTKGFLLAQADSTVADIGDEPLQIWQHFPQITVAVDEKRVRGVEKIMKLHPRVDVVLLDDAYQHRQLKAGLNILLTEHDHLYTDDYPMPYGRLREKKKNSHRADIIIVTKCENELPPKAQQQIRTKLSLSPKQQLFFSSYEYGRIYPIFDKKIPIPILTVRTNVLLITGIENPKPMVRYLTPKVGQVETMHYPDHYEFTIKDLSLIESKFFNLPAEKIIITTEKDATRLSMLSDRLKNHIFALPLEVKILHNEQEIFIQKINDYVAKNKRNS